MSKRHFKPLAVPPPELQAEAATLPTQHIANEKTTKRAPSAAQIADVQERMVRLALDVRENLRAELRRAAADRSTSIQAIILEALKGQGFSVRDDDLIDKRTKPKT